MEVSHSLHQLPQSIPGDYVKHWCDKHAIEDSLLTDDSSEIVENSKISFDTQNSYSCSEGCNRRVPNENVIENFSLEYKPSIKYLLKKKNGVDIPNIRLTFDDASSISAESGILTLPNTLSDTNSLKPKNLNNKLLQVGKMEFKTLRDTSSDYFTSNEISGSTNILEQNIYEITSSSEQKEPNSIRSDFEEKSIIELNSTVEVPNSNTLYVTGCEGSSKDESFLSIAEVYKYVDNEEGIVLYEKRLVKNSNW